MKKILLILIMVLFIIKGVYAQNSWQLQTSPVGSDLVSVWFTDSLSGWIAAEDGTVLHTVNSGKTWEVLAAIGHFTPVKIVFANHTLGWMAGTISNAGDSACVFRTQDGGANWYKVLKHSHYRINDLFFINDTLGWIAGYEISGNDTASLLLHTIDGGESWTMPKGIRIQDMLYAVHFRDMNFGEACGQDGIFLTTNNGGLGEVFGWAAEISIPSHAKDLYGIFNSGSQNGCAVGEGGFILLTKDKWANHYDYTSNSGDTLLAVAGDSSGIRYWAVGRNGCIVNIVVGFIMNITEADRVTPKHLNDIMAFNSNNIWAVGENGTIIYYGLLTENHNTIVPNNIRVYPNPSGQFLFVESPGQNISGISLFSVDGKEVMRQLFEPPVNYCQTDISALPEGVYIVTTGNYFGKFIIGKE
ncbi:MAG: T9SS type A sorting domain-containing protein [Bacteroidales bacterium]|nr:T9SS type A sorting domain-containing protein [Bacteroidales bacterium]